MNAIAYRVEPGYRFPEETLIVTEERQRWLHACCDIPHGFYGGRTDPSVLATRPIKVIGQALFANFSDRGYVHTQSRIRQRSSRGFSRLSTDSSIRWGAVVEERKQGRAGIGVSPVVRGQEKP